MTESVKSVLLNFYHRNPGKCYAGFELKKLVESRNICYFDGSKLDATERSLCNRSYEISKDINTGVTSRKRIVNGDKKNYNEYGYKMINQEEMAI